MALTKLIAAAAAGTAAWLSLDKEARAEREAFYRTVQQVIDGEQAAVKNR